MNESFIQYYMIEEDIEEEEDDMNVFTYLSKMHSATEGTELYRSKDCLSSSGKSTDKKEKEK